MACVRLGSKKSGEELLDGSAEEVRAEYSSATPRAGPFVATASAASFRGLPGLA